MSDCNRDHVECEQTHGDYWTTEPWDFGGVNQGRLWGDGLKYQGCLAAGNQQAEIKVKILSKIIALINFRSIHKL